MALPWHDPQFWLVTGVVAAIALLAARRIARSLGSESEAPCASCPKVVLNVPAPAAKRARLPVVALALVLVPFAAAAESVERRVSAMGTTLGLAVEVASDRGAALELAEAMIREVEATEAALSTWRHDSALAALNRAPVGRWTAWASPRLARAVGSARACSERTGGAFDLTVGPLVAAWGLRDGGRVPKEEELALARSRVDWRALRARDEEGGFLKRQELIVEEGGFGKGAALDFALAVADGAAASGRGGRVRLDFGGQIAWTNAIGETVIFLADPRDRARPVLELALVSSRGSVSTSANSPAVRQATGSAIGHLIDPKSGRPAPDFGSATVVSRAATTADCLSTGLFVMGPDAGVRFLAAEGHRDEAVFLIVEGDRLRARLSPGLAGRARSLVEGVEIEIANGS